MGAGSSSIQAFPTDVQVKTADGRYVANEIFRFMVLQMKYNEFLALGNPEACKNYVVLMADALEKYFYKMRFFPQKATSSKSSYIYFRKVTDLKDVSPDVPRFCMAIAYFFIRLFQIYGALAISILDTDTQVYGMFGGGDEDEGEDESEDEEGIHPQTGGVSERALTTSNVLLGDFNELRRYLRITDVNPDYYKFEGVNLFLKKDSESIFDKGKVTDVHELVFEKDVRRPIKAYISVHITPAKRLNIEFVKVEGVKTPIEKFAYTFSKKGGISSEWRREDRSIPQFLYALMYKIYYDDQKNRGIDNRDESTKDKNKYDIEYEYKKRTTSTDTWDESKMKEQYKTRDLWQTLRAFQGFEKGKSVKAHCIARALQLVSSRALEQAVPAQIISTACHKGFLGAQFPGSVPLIDEEISKEKGIFVLNQLFYDRILPDLTPSMSPLAKQRYAQTISFYQKVFQSTGTDIKTIRSKSASKLCAGVSDKQSLASTDKTLIAKLRAIVKSMLLRQIDHTAKVTLILKKLFLVEKGKPVRIHPQVLEGGIPVLNKIGEEARDLLIQYYVNCEKSYADGLVLLEASKKQLRVF